MSMRVDLAGKIRNTTLPKQKALLPMFEAVVNSFQAIEESTYRSIPASIEIVVRRDPVLKGLDAEGGVDGFSINDTGVGFNDLNFDAFFTSDTQYKANRGGKGLGRFVWLKAFDRAHIVSRFVVDGQAWVRGFDFALTGEQEEGVSTRAEVKEPYTHVELIGFKQPYKENCPRHLEGIGHRLIEHCLPFFLDPNCPAITIRDEQKQIDLRDYFREKFASKASRHEFTVDSERFSLKGIRLYHSHEPHHRLLYAANSREVITDNLDTFLPNLQRRLTDEVGEQFVYLGFVEGAYLNDHVNGERTSFTFPIHDRGENRRIPGDIGLDDIRVSALACVTEDLKQYLDVINEQKKEIINRYIAHEAPEYRPLARYIDEFIDQIQPGARGASLETALHQQLYQRQRQLKQESRVLMDESEKAALKPEEYESRLSNFIERENELGKSSLAQYVAHRKVILEFLEKSLRSDPTTGKYPLEDVIHRIIYPMQAMSDDVPYEQQNLWIIDERLSYHWFLASDKRLDSIPALSNDSSSRPDLLIFDRALTFAEDEGPLQSFVIVEFKRPDRANFGSEDPIDQVYRLIREIRAGHFKDKNGREIKVQSDRIPAYAYIICDTKKEIDTIAENKGMIRTPDNLGHYVYNPTLLAYVEIISYDKLLGDAKKRNRILFEKLQLPS
jgi:hypothetical protein